MGSSSVYLPTDGSSHTAVRAGQQESSPSQPSPGPLASMVARPRHRPGPNGSPSHLAITRRPRKDQAGLIVRVRGDIDLLTAPMLAEALDCALRDLEQIQGSTGLVVDLRAVEFLSAVGLGVLAALNDICTNESLSLVVVADQPAVTQPLSLTGLDHSLDLRPALV